MLETNCIHRWKEYGEITHQQADATSILFLFAKSRWSWRVLSGLAMASSLSLELMTYLINHRECDPDHSYLDESTNVCDFTNTNQARWVTFELEDLQHSAAGRHEMKKISQGFWMVRQEWPE